METKPCVICGTEFVRTTKYDSVWKAASSCSMACEIKNRIRSGYLLYAVNKETGDRWYRKTAYYGRQTPENNYFVVNALESRYVDAGGSGKGGRASSVWEIK